MVRITPLDCTLGARVTGVALGAMSDGEWRQVEDAFHEHGALVFPAQHLSDEEHIAFGERFGEIEILREGQRAVRISNRKADGELLDPEEKRYQVLRGNEGWHTDSSYMPLAAKASALAAEVTPSSGGETELADMRHAWDTLDEAMQERIAGLSAYHSLYASQAKAGFTAFRAGDGYGYHNAGAPLRPLVKTHPVTGRKSLFIGRHAFRIPGMADGEAQALLDELLDHACRPPRVYTHHWRPGDLMIWDNRCILHRACPYDYGEPRVMRHVRVAGDPASELAETVPDERADAFEPAAVAS